MANRCVLRPPRHLNGTLSRTGLPATASTTGLRARPFSRSTPVATKARESSADSPFSFLPTNALVPKSGRGERSKGLTEIRGSYYNPVTYTYLDELLGDWGGG